jgi:4'-phosphopantetheinyl transferase
LGPADVHIWAAPLEVSSDTLSRFTATLSAPEQERAARFRFEQHRHRFIAGRGLLRLLLSRYLQTEPCAVQFAYGTHGKPSLASPWAGSGLHFNLAHSENLVLLGVTRAGPVGVDVEHIRMPADADQLVRRFFSARESAAFGSLTAVEKPAAFFNLWTRKEAWLKATGEGIGDSLGRVEVSFLPGEPARLLALPEDSAPLTHWTLQDLSPAPGFAAALALANPTAHLHCWHAPESSPR